MKWVKYLELVKVDGYIRLNIAGTAPTAQELEQLNKLVTAQGDTLIGSQGPNGKDNQPAGNRPWQGFQHGHRPNTNDVW